MHIHYRDIITEYVQLGPMSKTSEYEQRVTELGVDRLSAWPIIGADIKHFTDYRYRPFSKHICRYIFFIIFFYFFFIMQTNILFTGDIIYW